jgi:hypothetical protein
MQTFIFSGYYGHHESFEIHCYKRIEKTCCTDRVKNEVLHNSKGGKEYPPHHKKKAANWIGHILCRNCLLNHFIERKKEEYE